MKTRNLKMSTSNCVNDENDDRIVTLCDMTGTLHTFNIGIEETFELLGEKVKEKLQLEKCTHDVYFFNREGTEKKKKNDKVDIVNSEVDSEPDFRFIVDMIKPIPICVEENEVYDLEIIHTIEYNNILDVHNIPNEDTNSIGGCGIKIFHDINISHVFENSFVFSLQNINANEWYNYLYTYDEINNKWVSTKLPKNVFHVYPDGTYVEDERLCWGYSYMNTTIIPITRNGIKCFEIKNKNDTTIGSENFYLGNPQFKSKHGKYFIVNTLSKLYIINADTSSIINIFEQEQFGKFGKLIDEEHIAIHEELPETYVLYKINFFTGNVVDSIDNKNYFGQIIYNVDENTYHYKKIGRSLSPSIHCVSGGIMLSKQFIVLYNYSIGRIDILRIKND